MFPMLLDEENGLPQNRHFIVLCLGVFFVRILEVSFMSIVQCIVRMSSTLQMMLD